jgi:hypothetical protein
LSRNTGHLESQPPDVLTRPGGNGPGEPEIILLGKYVSDDVWSVKDNPLGSTTPIRAEVDADDADVLTDEGFATERTGGGEARRGLGNDLFAGMARGRLHDAATTSPALNNITFTLGGGL